MRRRASSTSHQFAIDLDLVDSSLPTALTSKPFIERFLQESKQNHKWAGVVYHFSPHFSRMLRVLSLGTNMLVMLFMNAVTYAVTNPDDGSCVLMTTIETCLEQKSTLARGESMCYWTPDRNDNSFADDRLTDDAGGVCAFREPADDM
jgi:hypothetical protein